MRVSIGEGGFNDNGNVGTGDASIARVDAGAETFSCPDALGPDDVRQRSVRVLRQPDRADLAGAERRPDRPERTARPERL